jgi:hydroxylamine reductase (hybrid-cluster protein)
MSEQVATGQPTGQETQSTITQATESQGGVSNASAESVASQVAHGASVSVTEDGRLIVNGKETNVTVSDLDRVDQLTRESYKRFEEAAKARKEAEALRAQVKSPDEIKKEHEKELAEWYQEQQLLEGMSETERKLYLLEKKEAAREKEELTKKEQAELAKIEQENADFVLNTERSYIEHLESSPLVPADTTFVDLMFKHHISAIEAKIPGITPKYLEERAVDEFSGSFQGLVKKASEQNKMDFILDKVIGPEMLKLIRKSDLARLKVDMKPKVEAKPEPKPEPEAKPRPYKGKSWGLA